MTRAEQEVRWLQRTNRALRRLSDLPTYRVERSEPAVNSDGSLVLDDHGRIIYTKTVVRPGWSREDFLEGQRLMAEIAEYRRAGRFQGSSDA